MATTSSGSDRGAAERPGAKRGHDLARRVRQGRDVLNLTQEELASRAGISVRTVRAIEAGRTVPRADTVRRIAAALAAQDVSHAVGRDPGRTLVPAQLPPVGGPFVGRVEEIERLDDLLLPASVTDRVGACVLSGTAGVGKTALALCWAHRSAADFPDGQLFADLRGYDPEEPARPLAVLTAFLRELDPGTEPPHDLAAASARFRTVTAGRTLLVVLDNASSEEQVRPLLPGSATCRALVTSRDALPGLVARDGAARVELDLLPAGDALDLLATVLPDRVVTESGAAARLVAACARLPLALRIAAEAAASRPRVPLAALADQLTDESERLEILDRGDDPRTTVETVFSWSYRQLDEPSARAFRLLGLYPFGALDELAVAALLGGSRADGGHAVGLLLRAHLVQTADAGHVTMHDLLRAYAHRQLLATEPPGDREAATARLVDHYLAEITRCMDLLYPHEYDRRPSVPGAAGEPAGPFDADAARVWLDRERETVLNLAGRLSGPRWAGPVAQLSGLLWRHLFVGGHYVEAIALHRHALALAEAAGDRTGQANASRHLAGVLMRVGDYPGSMELCRRALGLYRELGLEREEGSVHNLRGVLNERMGSHEDALACYRHANAIARRTDDPVAESSTLNNLGSVLERLGRVEEAIGHYEQALVIRRRVGDRPGEGLTLGNLGIAYRLAGRHTDAMEANRQALRLARQVGERNDEAYALEALGATYRALGRLDEADESVRGALEIARTTRNRPLETSALNAWGEVTLARGAPAGAAERHRAALAVARGVGDRYQEARALSGTADALHALGDLAGARALWTNAYDLYAALGVPEAAAVRARLEAVPTGSPSAE